MAKDVMFSLIERKSLLVDKSWNESKKMWHIAGPAILAGVCQFLIGFVTVAFVGHLGDTELAAVSVVQNVIEGFVFGFMMYLHGRLVISPVGCLEMWYFTAIIILVGCLKNPEIAVDAMSICMNLELWAVMVALGFNAAVSVRVSNELGAGNPKAAKFSVGVAVCTAALFGILFMIAVLATKDNFPKLFTTEPIVVHETSKLGYFLAATILASSVQPVLHGIFLFLY
ncbi:hypothetical protein MKW98_013605 [Papaver atlanticum]|uniref:Uncharacterized protein n=1 Tax=Papaver atlanticum TaxID=357466 RepID=A0AAD4RYE4_9MAGN|nr:hypothetical protein MKW98_013605 [Papaver atlanticum]